MVQVVSSTTPRHGEVRTRLARFLYGPEEVRQRALLNPQGMTAHDGSIYICDQSLPGVHKYDPNTGEIRRWTSLRDGPLCPVHLAFDDANLAYVSDTTLGRIFVFDAYGKRLRELGGFNGSRSSALLFHGGVLFVADQASRTIARFDTSSDSWLDPIPRNQDGATLGIPTGLAIDDHSDLLVSDALLGIVHRMTLEGKPLPPIGRRGRGPGELIRPMHVATSPNGLVLVIDAARQTLMIYRNDGEFVMEIGGPKDAWSGFTLPCGVALVSPDEKKFEDTGTEPETRCIVSDTLGEAPLLSVTIRRLDDQEKSVE